MSFSCTIARQSGWEFVTFGGAGVGVGIWAASGGQVVLKDPSGASHTFTYGGAGAGLSAGLRLPKIGKLQIQTRRGPLPVSGAGAPFQFPSTGAVYVTDQCETNELTRADIRGPCAFIEVGGGVVAGASAVAMLLDLNPLYLGLLSLGPAAMPVAMERLINSASAALLMAGVNVGIQAQIGGAVYLGGLA